MFPPLKLGRLLGIPLVVHWTFWILPLWALFTESEQVPVAFRLVVLFAMFGCVILHELGHAVAGRHYGIRTRDITLYPIGGVASMERISEKPVEELVIAVAGPAVNVAIAGVLGLGLMFAAALVPAFASTWLGLILWNLLLLNLLMIVFNMIPAFPLDGGRVFRSLLAMFMSHLQATRIAVYAGSVLTVVLLALVVLLLREHTSPFLIVIALFVFMAGQRELLVLEIRERMRRLNGVYPAPAGAAVNETVADPLPWVQPPVRVHVWDPHTEQWVLQERN